MLGLTRCRASKTYPNHRHRGGHLTSRKPTGGQSDARRCIAAPLSFKKLSWRHLMRENAPR